jgi:hypothetical protein
MEIKSILLGFSISFLFLIGGILRLLLRPISIYVAHSIPWLFLAVGFIIGKGSYLQNSLLKYYWYIFLTAIISAFLLRAFVSMIEYKITGKIGLFSDSGSMFIIGGLIGMIVKLII